MNPTKFEKPSTLDEVARIWSANGAQASAGDVISLGQAAIELGNPTLAFDILKAGLRRFPENDVMLYYAALALARSGATRLAASNVSTLITRLNPESAVYADALSLAGRIAKEEWRMASDSKAKVSAAHQSAARYRAAFDLTGDFFPGINAATMTAVGGDKASAASIAERVLEICLDGIDNDDNDHWVYATAGEANLLLGRSNQAVEWYAKAVKVSKGRFGDIATMRRQVGILAEAGIGIDGVLDALSLPAVITFAGHMIDDPGRTPPRFPANIEAQVGEAIREAITRLDAGIGYCSAACGADILFAEAMLDRGGEINVIIPFRREDFLRESVAFAGEVWVRRFDDVLARATTVQYATQEGYLGDDCLFAYASDLMVGAAMLRAGRSGVDPVFLVAVEAEAARREGGTSDSIAKWRGLGLDVEVVDVGAIRESAGTKNEPGTTATSGSEPPKQILSREIRSMLFADVVGFSRMREEETPSFIVDFMGHIARIIEKSSPGPSFSNTWGDGLFIVFDDIVEAVRFALDLRDDVAAKNWTDVGFPEDVGIRIGMHAGPVYAARDPILNRTNYFGSHVTRAARIEPITPPGEIYVSEQTACLLSMKGAEGVVCDYIGATKLAKQFGSAALYRLRRARG